MFQYNLKIEGQEDVRFRYGDLIEDGMLPGEILDAFSNIAEEENDKTMLLALTNNNYTVVAVSEEEELVEEDDEVLVVEPLSIEQLAKLLNDNQKNLQDLDELDKGIAELTEECRALLASYELRLDTIKAKRVAITEELRAATTAIQDPVNQTLIRTLSNLSQSLSSFLTVTGNE
jgi:hypothetical protein